MSDIQLDNQSKPTAPAAGSTLVYPDSTSLKLVQLNPSGVAEHLAGLSNFNTADAVASGADTYLANSMITIPSHGLQAGTVFRWKLGVTKSAAGVAAPTWIIRVGTAGTTADTARVTFTGPAQTGVVDTAWIDIVAVLRNTGASGVLAGILTMAHNLAATGFANIQAPTLQVTSAGFDTTVANLKVGLSVNPGASGVWTHQVVIAEAWGI